MINLFLHESIIKMNWKNIYLIGVLLFATSLSEIVQLDKEIISQIYQQSKIVLIYIHGNNHHFQIQSVFNSYCFGEKVCAILQPNNPEYFQYLQFIGYPQNEFFLILDGITKRKFILDIPTSSFTTNDLLSFQYKFNFKQLQPYFSSENPPSEINSRCTKLVGKNVGEFLRRGERVKAILLYSLNQNCQICDEILQTFIPFAQRYYEESKLAFGYFNTFLNDHPTIQDQKTPSFLIFVDQQYQSPFVLEANNMESLSYFLEKMIGKHYQPIKFAKNDISEEQSSLKNEL